ncbi:hypothetical protein N9Y81_04205 [Akkermansiaceae bacterium]|nr:hypothetical protein [Akkermansiaceae bacterium]
MNVRLKLLTILISFAGGITALADEVIYPRDSFTSEKKFRAVVANEFPKLEMGFYHWNGGLIFGALENFDRHRIFFLLPFEGAGVAEMTRNGGLLPLPPGEPVTVKVAGTMLTQEGDKDDPESAVVHRLGYWLDLEATETLSILIKTTWPSVGSFEATYDPDAKWKTTFHWAEAEQHRRKPADAYEITRRSLSKRVAKVLGKKDLCVIRFEDGGDLLAKKFLGGRIQAASAIGSVGKKMSFGVWKSRHLRGLRLSLS